VNTDLSFCRCACCSVVHAIDDETSGDPYCDRCEVAYLEFKLGLLVAVSRASRKANEA
jgi:hypothetical protein